MVCAMYLSASVVAVSTWGAVTNVPLLYCSSLYYHGGFYRASVSKRAASRGFPAAAELLTAA